MSIASAFEGITSLLEPIDSLLGDNLLTVSLTASTQQLHTPNPQSVGSWRLSMASVLEGISSLLEPVDRLLGDDLPTVSLTAGTQ